MKKTAFLIFVLSLIVGSLSAQVTNFPFVERFEETAFPPANWSLLGGDVQSNNWYRDTFNSIAGDGSAMSNNFTMFGGALNPNNYLVTPALVMPEGVGSVVSWKASRAGANQTYSVLISTTTASISEFDELFTGDITLQTPEYFEGNIDLSEYAGETIYLAFRHHDSTQFPMFGVSGLLIDDISVSLLLDYDLSAESISGPTSSPVGEEIEFIINIKNTGAFEASDYTVKLVRRDLFGNLIVGSMPGVTLESGEDHDYIISWTPTIAGNYQMYGEVDYEDDEAAGNNQTNLHGFIVAPAAYTQIYIGNPSAGFAPQGPYQMNQQSTLMQTIYHEDLFEGESGTITHITYRFMGQGDISEDIIYRMYLATTDIDDFGDFEFDTNAPWIPFYHFTQVFEGTLPMSAAGIRDMSVVFDTPFEYSEGNLVIMTQRGEGDWGPNFGMNNQWQISHSEGNPTSLSYGGWALANPESPGNLFTSGTNNMPNITFHFLHGATGSLTGQVTHLGEPLEGVEILQNGTPRKVYSNAEGNYSLSYIPIGSLSITASKFMYVSQFIDDIMIVPAPAPPTICNIEMEIVANDLRAISLTGPNMPSEQQIAYYRMTIHNFGSITADDYTILLKQVVPGGDDIILDTASATPLPSMMSETFILSFIPPSQAAIQIYGELVFEENPTQEYNLTNTLTINPQPYGNAVAYVGIENSTHYQNNPHIALNLPTSISQMIYREDEIALYGPITEITYRFRGVGDVPEPVWVKFWAVITEMDEFSQSEDNPFLSDDWYPFDEMTLIYDSYIDVTGVGDRDITIELIEPFEYTGGNLLIASYSPMDFNRWYAQMNSWQQTTFAGQNKAIRHVDFVYYDFDNLFGGFITDYIPNTTFKFVTAGMGGVEGIITYDGFPMNDVEVSIEGTDMKRTTEVDGYFLFPHLPEGTHTINVKRYGYMGISREIDIIEDNIIEENFVLAPRPTVSVAGTVLASDTESGLPGATVTLNGYGNYETVTLTEGHFNIAGVFAFETYILTISKEDYVVHTESILVDATDYLIPPITLRERPLRPRNVVALSTDNLVMLSWDSPSMEDKIITQAAQDVIFDGIGTGSAYQFTVAHRFTEAQLATLGVQHGTLTGLSIVTGERYASYALRVWTGGSDSPLNPGSLIYSGEYISGSDLVMYNWHDIDLLAPITIPAEGELWIGYEVDAQIGFPAGVDEGPGNNMFGNLITLDGEWTTLADIDIALADMNFLIKGYVTDAEGRGNVELGVGSVELGVGSVELGVEFPTQRVSGDSTLDLNSWQNANNNPVFKRSDGLWNTYKNVPHPSTLSVIPTQSGAKGRNLGVEGADNRFFTPFRMTKSDFRMTKSDFRMTKSDFRMTKSDFRMTTNEHSIDLPPQMQSLASRELLHYSIYRAPLATMYDENTWTAIALNISGNSHIDETWANIETGEFRYIVRGNYTNDNPSNPAFSNIVYKNMESVFDLTIHTFDDGPVTGALVRLVNDDGNPNHVYQQLAAQNRVIFPAVWHGIYTLSVELPGYHRIERRNLSVMDDFVYHVSLQQSITLFSENFDSNVFPPAGWSLIDHDGDGHNWQHLTGFSDQAHTFPYFVVSFTNNGQEVLTPDNFLFLPPMTLPADSDINLKYHIVTGSEFYPIETYSVIVQLTPPPIGNFNALFTETLNETHTSWQERNIDLSEYAGQQVYIAFRHHSSYNNNAIGLDTIEITFGDRVVSENEDTIPPTKTALLGNYPNPFNPETTINYSLSHESMLRIDIFNIKGQRINTLVNELKPVGTHSVVWNGTDHNGKNVATGIYFYQLRTDHHSEIKRMVLLK